MGAFRDGEAEFVALSAGVPVFINPRLPGFQSETLGFIPALARMTWLKHLKLPATIDAPTDVDAQVPRSAGIV
jgi:hypothetical protein